MIKSFRDRDTERLFNDQPVKRFQSFQRAARRKLEMLDAAATLGDLRIPPGNKLESLKGDRSGKYSIRINNRWRVCFIWRNPNAYEAEIVDYH